MGVGAPWQDQDEVDEVDECTDGDRPRDRFGFDTIFLTAFDCVLDDDAKGCPDEDENEGGGTEEDGTGREGDGVELDVDTRLVLNRGICTQRAHRRPSARALILGRARRIDHSQLQTPRDRTEESEQEEWAEARMGVG